ncbi:hypothetical protein KUTeg_021453 [Tegillarca granosa]|uniref:Uncharacterized protein n=1 Tax=Tegillarca granosa TaxID=220873 RepID=A0ABQ9E3M5_TEGGR|nr:hypothetical protein KUTeg_021453 [Tegillarca granosa]
MAEDGTYLACCSCAWHSSDSTFLSNVLQYQKDLSEMIHKLRETDNKLRISKLNTYGCNVLSRSDEEDILESLQTVISSLFEQGMKNKLCKIVYGDKAISSEDMCSRSLLTI